MIGEAMLNLKQHIIWGTFDLVQSQIDDFKGKNDFKTYSIQFYHTILNSHIKSMCLELSDKSLIKLDRNEYQTIAYAIMGKYAKKVSEDHFSMGKTIAEKYRSVTLVTRDRLEKDLKRVLHNSRFTNKMRAYHALNMCLYYVEDTKINMDRHNEVNGDLNGLKFKEYVNEK
jgi:hypothetical protein